jgi:hypothetical protein
MSSAKKFRKPSRVVRTRSCRSSQSSKASPRPAEYLWLEEAPSGQSFLKKLAVNSCVIRTFRNALENRLSAEKTVSYPLKFRSWMLTPRHDRRKSARSGSAEIRSQINAFSGVRRRVVYVGN